MMIRLFVALATAAALAVLGLGAAAAIGDTEIWDHLAVGVTLTKVSRGQRMIYTWDQAGGVQAFDLDDPGVTVVHSLADNTFEGFVAFVADQ